MRLSQIFEKSNHDVYIIAEVSQNHDGSLGQAHAFIDACAQVGVDAIKFQTHIAAAESTKQEPFRVKFSYEDKTRYDYWKRMEFTKEQWIELKQHAESVGLEFLSSSFSVEAFQLLDEIGIIAWKIGSGEVFNRYLIDQMLKTKKPILLSSGMSTYDDLDSQYRYISETNRVALFQCTTSYPNGFDTVGLNVIDEMKERYDCPIGLSDHSGTIYPALAAVARGASLIEVHVTLSKYMFGPDVSSSLDISELKEMVKGIRAISTMQANPVDKKKLDQKYIELKNIFAKGIYAKEDLKEGTVLSDHNIIMKKPLLGISADDYESVLGKRLKCSVKADEAITREEIF